MKRVIIVAVALLMTAGNAMAFTTYAHQAIACLADKYLTDQAKSEVKTILNSTMEKECVWLNTLRKKPELAHTKDWHFFQLNENVKSVTTNENDGIVQLEKAIAVLRNRKNENKESVVNALRTVIHLVGDMHCISHVRIEGVDDSYGFTFYHWNELEGKRRRDWKSGWYSHWQGGYLRRYSVFTPEYYSYDIDIYGKPLKADYEKGEPRFWAGNVGEDVIRALKDISNGETVPTNVIQTYEFLHTKCMVKAGYRLAALLNDIFK